MGYITLQVLAGELGKRYGVKWFLVAAMGINSGNLDFTVAVLFFLILVIIFSWLYVNTNNGGHLGMERGNGNKNSSRNVSRIFLSFST